MHDLKRNGSGYVDPTAEQAIKNVIKTDKRVSQTIKVIQAVAHLAGFEIEGRIILRDKETGFIWR
jgi:hypothetical protein